MRVLQVNENDNVLVALEDLSPGEEIIWNNHRYILPYKVKAKHKFVNPGNTRRWRHLYVWCPGRKSH